MNIVEVIEATYSDISRDECYSAIQLLNNRLDQIRRG